MKVRKQKTFQYVVFLKNCFIVLLMIHNNCYQALGWVPTSIKGFGKRSLSKCLEWSEKEDGHNWLKRVLHWTSISYVLYIAHLYIARSLRPSFYALFISLWLFILCDILYSLFKLLFNKQVMFFVPSSNYQPQPGSGSSWPYFWLFYLLDLVINEIKLFVHMWMS